MALALLFACSAAFAQTFPNVAQIGQNKIGTVTDNGGGSYTIVGGGNDIWDQRDEFTYAYTEVTGDFDVKVRVESLAFNATWSKAGIMARESLSEYSRMLFPRVTPDAGANDNRFAYRTGLDNNAGVNGGQHEDCTDCENQRPGNGHRWVRLARVGNVFTAYSSADGSAWTTLGTQDTANWGGGAMSPTLYLGLGVGRHSGGPTATAEFRDLGFTYAASLNLVAASSRGNPNGVRVTATQPVPLPDALNPAIYSLTSPSAGTIVTGLRFTTANDAPERDPMTFTLEGTTGDPNAGPWTLIASGNTGLPSTRRAVAPVVRFSNASAYTSYRLLFPTVRDAGTANSMQISEIEFLDAAGNDVTSPGDPVIGSSANFPGGEAPAMAIDNNSGSKYLNLDKLNTGLTVTPSRVPPKVTVVAGIRFTSANDSDNRDPMTFTLEGRVGDSAWSLIASGNTGLPTTRTTAGPIISFANTIPYSSYRVLFPTIRDAGTANSMQLAEIELLDASNNDVTSPADAIIGVRAVAGGGASEVAVVGTTANANNHPAAESPDKTIDNNNGTKYLNFAKLNTGVIITPAGGSTPTAAVMSVASVPGRPEQVQLTTTGLAEGASYVVSVPAIPTLSPVAFVHGAGFEARRIHITHNKTDDSGYYPASDAVRKGIGDIGSMIGGGTYPAVEPGTLFEDPIVDNGDNERFSTRIAGVLNVTSSGNHNFACSSDDIGRLYLSSNDDPANKTQIAMEPTWNGSRQYATLDRRNATTPENRAGPLALTAASRYYLEYIFTEGGGGNNGSAAWAPPGGVVPIPNGASPIAESAFVPSRMVDGVVFYRLGSIQISRNPSSISVPTPDAATFSVRADGTPNYRYQWQRKGPSDASFSDVSGATGPAYTLPSTDLALDNGAQYRVVVRNEFSEATSTAATLTVTIDNNPPTLASCVNVAGSSTSFDLVFSETVVEADAEDLANYSISGGVTLIDATLQPDNRTVRFNCSSLAAFTCKTLTVNNVRDRSNQANLIAANSTIGVVYSTRDVLVHRFDGIGGTAVSDLINNPAFPNSPSLVTRAVNSLDYAPNLDNYGARMMALLSPPVSGPYTFYLWSDDASAVWLSSDVNPDNKVLIMQEPGCCRAFPAIASVPVVLQAGCRYYIEIIFKEGGGGDYGRVTWRTPAGGPQPNVPDSGTPAIPGLYLSAFDVPATVLTDIADVTTTCGNRVTFNPTVIGTPPLTFQWFENGAPIMGATSRSYTTRALTDADSGVTFYLEATTANPAATVQTTHAMVTVNPDNTSPQLLSAASSPTFDTITLVFSKVMDQASAEDGISYTITPSGGGAFGPTAAALQPDGRTVVLSINPPLLPNTVYTVDPNPANLSDFCFNPVLATPATFRSHVIACGGLVWESYNTGGGVAVADLVNNANFPNNPDGRRIMNTFDTRAELGTDNFRDNFGARLRGVFVPPASGNYIFYVHSDDAAQVWINPSGPNPAGKVLVVEETGCCRDWPTVASGPVALTAGTACYIEGLYKEGGGGDYIRVAARIQGSADALVAIPLSQLGNVTPAGAAGSLTITQQPTDQSVMQNSVATFSIAATPQYNYHNVCYQWQRDGMDIPGANGPSYSYGPVPLADDGAVFRCIVSIAGVLLESAPAMLDVIPDTTPPTCVGATVGLDLKTITVRFSEFVDQSFAVDFIYYSLTLSGTPLNIQNIEILPDGMSVKITIIETLPFGDSVAITITDIPDLAGNPLNPACSLQARTPVLSCGFVKFDAYPAGGGTAVDQLTAHPSFPNSPDFSAYVGGFNTVLAGGVYANNSRENYGGRLLGYFIPPTSGNWIFYIRSDDASRLFLSTGVDPSAKVMIAEEPGCCAGFGAHPSAPVALTAGTPYYIEALYKEGGGGDYCQVAAKLETDPTIPDTLAPIPGRYLAAAVDPTGGSFNITGQPASTKVCLNLGGSDPETLKSENFDAGDGGGVVSDDNGPFEGPWTYNGGAGTWSSRGQGPELGRAPSTRLTFPAVTVTKSGTVRLSFSHRYSFEDGNWDGGQVRVSINGSAYTAVPSAAFSANGYSGSIRADTAAALAGQTGFVLTSPNYGTGQFITSVADLGLFTPGDTISVQFVAAFDTNTRQGDPAWEITSMSCTEGIGGGVVATFSVAASASLPGLPTAPVFYQWQRNCSGSWADIPGANGNSYNFQPLLTDNGCRFRAIVCAPGASTLSDEAVLTVVQPNTAPSFTKGSDQSVPEDAGAQSVPGFASNIQPDSIDAVTGSFSSAFDGAATQVPFNGSDFNSGVPAGAILYGNAEVGPSGTPAGGVLFLTRNVNSVFGALYTGADPIARDSYTITWNEYVGGGTCCGATTADGYSMNVASDLPVPAVYGSPAEDGAGTGLSVLFDTWDNGGGEAPAIDLKWQGTIIASAPVDPGQDGAAPTLRPVSVSVTSGGLATVVYNGVTLFNAVPLPGWGPQANLRVGFGARTGGANDNHVIDDLVITGIQGITEVPPAPPAGTATYGNAYIGGGALHLTDAANGLSGAFVVNDLLAGAPLGSFLMTFDALVGEGTAPPADGFSVSIAANLPAGTWALAEEGEGNGLSVCFDNFDNGGGEAPAIDVKWQGVTIAHTVVPSLETGGMFKPVVIKLDPDGTLDVIADGNPIYTDLPTGYSPIVGAKFGMGARTGGLNAKHWIDNLNIQATAVNAGDAEASQTVTFIVSNNNPGLFSTQPAIAADGTLTYTPAPNACGAATVTVVAQDNGGVDPQCGGRDTSAPCDFTITVIPVNDCPVTASQTVNVLEGGSVNISLVATDADDNGCGLPLSGISILVPPAHGTLSGTPPNLVYTPNPDYPGGCGHANGADSFTYVATDGQCNSESVVNVRVIEVNDCPVARADASILCALPTPINGVQLVVSANGSNACLILDGRLSSDVECDPLTYAWFANADVVPFSTSAVTTNCFPVGQHTIKLTVDDGSCLGMAVLNIEIVTPCDAIDTLIDDIENSVLERRNKRPLLASLKAACASFERDSLHSALGQLGAFQNKVRAQIAPGNPVEAARFIAKAQAIITAIECSDLLDQHDQGRGNDNR